MKPRLLYVLVWVLCLVPSARADDKADLADLEKASWKVTAINQGGKDSSAELLDQVKLTFTFKDGKLTIKSAGEMKEGTFKFDSTKAPKEMDLKMDKDKDADKAIYEITSDTLKIAIGVTERPKDFKGGNGVTVFTLERQK